MTYAGILDAFETTYTALREMHPSDLAVWCREMNNKPLAELREMYGVEESLLMALFCYDTNCQRFHSLPLTTRESDLVSIKNLFRIFVVRLKDKRVAGVDYSILTTSSL